MASWRRINRITPGELTVQEAIYDTLRRSEIRLADISNRTGIPYDTLKTWSCEPDNPSGAYRSMPVHQVPPVVNATRNFSILDTLEAACGRVGVEMPIIQQPTKDLVLEIARAVQEFGELATAAAGAIGDGRTTPEEATRIDEQGYEAIQQILRLMAASRQAASGRDQAHG